MDAPSPSATPTYASRTPLHVGAVALKVRDLDRLAAYYRHVLGLFPDATWRRLLAEAGLEPLELPVENPFAAEQAAFVARRLPA